MFVQCIVYCVQCTPFPPVAETGSCQNGEEDGAKRRIIFEICMTEYKLKRRQWVSLENWAGPSLYDFDHADCLCSLSIRPAAATQNCQGKQVLTGLEAWTIHHYTDCTLMGHSPPDSQGAVLAHLSTSCDLCGPNAGLQR